MQTDTLTKDHTRPNRYTYGDWVIEHDGSRWVAERTGVRAVRARTLQKLVNTICNLFVDSCNTA